MNQQSLFLHLPWQRKARKSQEESYQQFLSEMREDASRGEGSEFLSQDFQDEFKSIIKRSELEKFSPKKFYWLNLIDSLAKTIYSPEFINPKENQEHISQIKDIQELQIISFFHLHIGKEKWNPSGPVAYCPLDELGESQFGLYLGEDLDYYALPSDLSSFKALPIIAFSPTQKILEIDLENEILAIQGREFLHKKYQNNFPQIIPNFALQDSGRKFKIYQQFEKAHLLIKELDPHLGRILASFISYIIPTNFEDILSDTMDTLPQFSSLNLFRCDLIDLMVALFREAGQHILNSLYEGEEELFKENIQEDSEELYRIIFLSFFSYALLKELTLQTELHPNLFPEKQREKMTLSLQKEKMVILSSYEELEGPQGNSSITDLGREYLSQILSEVRKDSSP